MLLVMGYMNAKVGSDNTDRKRDMGSQGCGTITSNDDALVNFYLNNNCAIGGSIFQHKDIHTDMEVTRLIKKQLTKLTM